MFNYKWYLKDGFPAKNIKQHNKLVFSTFACGGGSSMGYKLAGYNVIGCNEIDKKINNIYIKNFNPKYNYLEDIRSFIKRQDLPQELYNLDILDGSPPCSVFSIAGKRNKLWGIKKKFREGQELQILDDLLLEQVKLVNKLKPKISLIENVYGLIQGKAKGYILEIKKELDKIGYETQIFKLNASTMGVPQNRVRVFIISRKKDLKLNNLELKFNQKAITLKDIQKDTKNIYGKKLDNIKLDLWKKCLPAKSLSTVHYKGNYFNTIKQSPFKPLSTITASRGGPLLHYKEPFEISDELYILGSSFPLDFNFLNNDIKYICGMSVPPIMIANIAYEIYKQWLIKFN